MTANPELTVSNLRHRMDQFELEITQLELIQGETLSIVGPTGAGKTTLLRSMAGLLPPTSGSIQWRDTKISDRGLPIDLRRQMTFVHQRPCLLRGTVSWNVGYGLRCRRSSNVDAKVAEILKRLQIESLAKRSIQKLSTGQAQLVALARALVLDTNLLFLDEPTSSLDPRNVAIVEAAIESVREARPLSIVWVTHNLFQAKRVAHRTAFIWEGKLVEISSTDEFFKHPKDPRTADFVTGKLVY